MDGLEESWLPVQGIFAERWQAEEEGVEGKEFREGSS
jgi:hypothetical protein